MGKTTLSSPLAPQPTQKKGKKNTNFTGNGGRRSPAVVSVPIDLDGRPNYFTTSGNSFKKYYPEFPKNWMHTESYDHMISV